MSTVMKIKGLCFQFPFTPYPSQVEYMNSLVIALNKKENAMLESPTGTGKTLSLLIPALAYQERYLDLLNLISSHTRKSIVNTKKLETNRDQIVSGEMSMPETVAGEILEWAHQTFDFKDSIVVDTKLKTIKLNSAMKWIAEQPPPRIIYAARTHAQIEQAVKQLKLHMKFTSNAQTDIHPNNSSLYWPVAMLGSRRVFCINEKAHTYAAAANITLDMACKKLCDDRQCKYYSSDGNNEEIAQKYRQYYHENNNGKLDDLEDFLRYCKRELRCPYYLGRALVPQAKLITAPYNYILSNKSRTSELSNMLHNSILLIDEGHNIGQACCDVFSNSIMVDSLLEASNEILYLQKMVATKRLGSGDKAATIELEGNWLSKPNVHGPMTPYTGISEPKTKTVRQSVGRLYSLSDALPSTSDINAIYNLITTVSRYFKKHLADMKGDTVVSIDAHDICKTVYELLLATNFDFNDDNTQVVRGSKIATDNETAKFYLSSKSILAQTDTIQTLFKKQSQFSLLIDTISILIQSNPDLAPEYVDKPLHLLETCEFVLAISNVMAYSQIGSEFQFIISKQKDNDTNSRPIKSKSARGMSELLNTVIIKCSSNAASTATRSGLSVHLLCVSPKSILKTIVLRECVRSLVLTSGTLSPFSALQTELGLSFGISISCSHIVPPSNYLLRAIRNVSGTPLLGTYTNRETNSYQKLLGYALQTCVYGVIGGTLVFFSSYKYMAQVLDSWKKDGTETRLKASAYTDSRDLFIEPVQQRDCDVVIKQYKDSCDAGRFPILFVVCRGKLAEGIDFSNNYCRCAIIISLPYPNISDPLLKAKMDWFDKNSTLKGNDWYSVYAYRSINQALGRVLRHKDDYGCMFLLDQRYSAEISRKQLSGWLVEHLSSTDLSGSNVQQEKLVTETRIFYSNHTPCVSLNKIENNTLVSRLITKQKVEKPIFETRNEVAFLMKEITNPLKDTKFISSSASSNETLSETYQLMIKFKGKLTETKYKQLKTLLRDVQLIPKSDQDRIQSVCSDLATLLYNRTLSREVSDLLKTLEPRIASELDAQIKFVQKRS